VNLPPLLSEAVRDSGCRRLQDVQLCVTVAAAICRAFGLFLGGMLADKGAKREGMVDVVIRVTGSGLENCTSVQVSRMLPSCKESERPC
jgi:hypothetical protein